MLKSLYFVTFLTFTVPMVLSKYKPPEDFCERLEKEKACEGRNIPKHIYCGGIPKKDKQEFLGNTPNKIELDSEQKNIILHSHNELRNVMGCGEPVMTNFIGETFPRAARMPKLMWDEELEWGADINAKQCTKTRDCPVTYNYLEAGQNMGARQQKNDVNVTDFLRRRPKIWWLEYLNTRVEAIDMFNARDKIKNYTEITDDEVKKIGSLIRDKVLLNNFGQFSLFAREKITKIGCAVYSCGAAGGFPKSYTLVCNYDYANMKGEPIYTRYTDGYQCRSNQLSKVYCCLCLQSDDHTEDNIQNGACFKTAYVLPNFSDDDEQKKKKGKCKRSKGHKKEFSCWLIFIILYHGNIFF